MNTITKRCAALLLSTALLVPLLAPSSRAATSVNVSVNGTPVAFSSATGTPFLDQNGRTQVPLRVTMEAMGATVGWDNAARTATVSKGSVSIRIPIGTSFILVNGVKKSNDTTAQIVNGRSYLPIRIVAPGRVYRKDEVDATHSPMFHQIEGMVIDKGVTMSDLKATLNLVVEKIYGKGTVTRFRPHLLLLYCCYLWAEAGIFASVRTTRRVFLP